MSLNPLNEDLNIISSLVIPELDEDLDVIQKLDDEPNDVGGLTASELKAEYDEGTQLIREGFEEEGRQLQEQAHLMAEYQRAFAGYSGGGSGADRILPELTAQENQIMTAEGKQALRAAKRLYELGEETGNEELKETGRILGQNVRLTQNSYDLDKIRELRSKEPTVKRTDAHGRPIYTPTELEAEGQRNFFPAIWNQITGSLLSLGEAAHAATREAISNRNNVCTTISAHSAHKDRGKHPGATWWQMAATHPEKTRRDRITGPFFFSLRIQTNTHRIGCGV